MKQIIFKRLDTGIINAGFIEDGAVYCGCCGERVSVKKISIIKTFKQWTDIQAAICANVDATKYIKGGTA